MNEGVFTSDLKYDWHGYWVEQRNNVDRSGLVKTRTIRYVPIGNGRLRVEMSDGMYAGCKIEMVETSPYLVIITAVDSFSGKPKLVETFTIINTEKRIHTIQDFSSNENLAEVIVMEETRILDPSATSIAPYESVNIKTETI